METDAAVEKPGKFFHSRLQNACWRFAQFPQSRRRLTNKQTKPDKSFATETGHFYLLPTGTNVEQMLSNRRESAIFGAEWGAR